MKNFNPKKGINNKVDENFINQDTENTFEYNLGDEE